MIAGTRNTVRRIAFIGSACRRHQHDGCQAQGKGEAAPEAAIVTSVLVYLNGFLVQSAHARGMLWSVCFQRTPHSQEHAQDFRYGLGA
jgi:hypothetical protein